MNEKIQNDIRLLKEMIKEREEMLDNGVQVTYSSDVLHEMTKGYNRLDFHTIVDGSRVELELDNIEYEVIVRPATYSQYPMQRRNKK